MKFAGFVITAVVVGLSGPAFAQGESGQLRVTNPPVNQAVANTPSQLTGTTPSSDRPRSWVASGWVGANFGSSRSTNVDLSIIEDLDTNSGSGFNFGGQIAYLGRGVIGGEFLADFSPGLGTLDNALFEASPDVNSYMFNLIAVAPFGQAHRFDPYISGGIGAVTISADIFAVNPLVINPLLTNTLETVSVSGSKFGWDLGGGLMAFSARNWGFRGDIRYYKTGGASDTDVFDINNIGDGSVFSRVELSGLSFWKANAGLAFRW